ncbi:MAG TPA: hemolysin family protein [Longimicrobium sp.]|nr:hemolysin family protein [Longimicrobium sp.]
MSGLGFEIALIVVLIVLNGVFAMSEIAVVSSRRTRLQERADAGDAGARRALALSDEPTRFLSTVQIGITLIGTLAGAFGGATIAEELAPWIARSTALRPYAPTLALGMVVLLITYLSLVIGELVPKRIGLNAPERIASRVSGPMNVVSFLAAPAVKMLTVSTELLLKLLRVRKGNEPPVSEAEIAVMMEQATQAGVFQEEEQDLVERVFWLGDQRAGGVMTPRHRIVWLNLEDAPEENWRRMVEHRYTRYLLCDGSLDAVRGMVDVKDLWAARLEGGSVALEDHVRDPLYIPSSTRALHLLERFRASGVHLAVVVDEYGGIEGLVTLNDLLQEIAGDLTITGATSPPVVRRDDGSLLVDGSYAIDDFRQALGLPERRGEPREYRTVGGLVFTLLGHVPTPGEHVEHEGWRVEVMDMDGNRVDKVLATPHIPAEL